MPLISSSPKLVLIGPPGSGKGTLAEKLSGHYFVPHITTGGMVREEVECQTALGRKFAHIVAHGDLLPDREMLILVEQRLSQRDAVNGFILDGFPRDLHQAKLLAATPHGARLDAAIVLHVPEEEVIRRLQGRLVCSSCGRSYHEIANPPKKPMTCDFDGTALSRRGDDTTETIIHRLDVYHEMAAPLIAYYRALGLARVVDAAMPPDAVFGEMTAFLQTVLKTDRAARTRQPGIQSAELRIP